MEMEIIAINEEKVLANYHMGIRFTDEELGLGDDVSNSYDFSSDQHMDENDEWKYEELEGACALAFGGGFRFDDVAEMKEEAVKVVEKVGTYPYDYAYIIAGMSHRIGEDDHEIVIRCPEVVAIVKFID